VTHRELEALWATEAVEPTLPRRLPATLDVKALDLIGVPIRPAVIERARFELEVVLHEGDAIDFGEYARELLELDRIEDAQ
jgi:hypothetical protein